MSLRDDILSRPPPPPVRYDSADWGVIWLKIWTGIERGEWDKFASESADPETGRVLQPALYRATCIQRTVCDESGKLVFTPDDIPLLLGSDGGTLFEIFAECVRVNRLSYEEVARARADFFARRQCATGTVSPGNSAAQSPKSRPG